MDYIRCMLPAPPPLAWLNPGQDFPPVNQTWGADSPAPGLLAAGGVLDVETLCRAYSQGVFPWFSKGQPVLWWSPDPRMVLQVEAFHVHRSFKKSLRKFVSTDGCEIRMDSAFDQVIRACATRARAGQNGTWILPDMVAAYGALHRAGYAHSVETWIHGQLVGGLYCVALGKAVFGESMFSCANDTSKIALAALICFCRRHSIQQIDCQQKTSHLASMGAREVSRAAFIEQMTSAQAGCPPDWKFETLYWHELIHPTHQQRD